MTKFRLFIDSDVIVDLLANRPDHQAAAELFGLVERHKIGGYTTPIVLANVEYIIRKYSGKANAKRAIAALIKVVEILPVDHSTAKKAVESTFSDFEDALQYFAAERAEMDFIITRNKKDYRKGAITVQTAAEFIDLHEATGEKTEA